MSQAKQKDDILRFLLNSTNSNKIENTAAIASHILEALDVTDRLCHAIQEDGFNVYNGTPPDGALKIRRQGIDFLEQGGYEQRDRINQLQTANAQTKHELEIQQLQSVIATNTATIAAYTNQEKLNKRALYLTGASVLFIIFSTILQLCSKTDTELQGIKEQLQKSSQTLDSIRLSLKSPGSSMKTFVERSDTSRH